METTSTAQVTRLLEDLKTCTQVDKGMNSSKVDVEICGSSTGIAKVQWLEDTASHKVIHQADSPF